MASCPSALALVTTENTPTFAAEPTAPKRSGWIRVRTMRRMPAYQAGKAKATIPDVAASGTDQARQRDPAVDQRQQDADRHHVRQDQRDPCQVGRHPRHGQEDDEDQAGDRLDHVVDERRLVDALAPDDDGDHQRGHADQHRQDGGEVQQRLQSRFVA